MDENLKYKLRKTVAGTTRTMEKFAHRKPDITKKLHENALKKIATKGVVRLFNAVKDFQSKEHRASAEAKIEKAKKLKKNIRADMQRTDTVSKTAFLDILKKGPKLDSEFTA